MSQIEQYYISGFLAEYDTRKVYRVIESNTDREDIKESPKILILQRNAAVDHVAVLREVYEGFDNHDPNVSLTLWITEDVPVEFPPKDETAFYWRKTGALKFVHDIGGWRRKEREYVTIGNAHRNYDNDDLTNILEKYIGSHVVIQLQKRKK